MSQQPKRNIKLTHIPLTLQTMSNIGIINFPTQKYEQNLDKPQVNLKNVQQQITFKNALNKVSDSQDSDDDYVKKKIIASNRITIRADNIKKRYFRVDIPISAKGGPQGVKQSRQKLHFIVQFNQSNNGTLSIVDDVYDAQVQITNVDNQATMSERIKLQDAKMDARRKEEKIEVQEKKEPKDTGKKKA